MRKFWSSSSTTAGQQRASYAVDLAAYRDTAVVGFMAQRPSPPDMSPNATIGMVAELVKETQQGLPRRGLVIWRDDRHTSRMLVDSLLRLKMLAQVDVLHIRDDGQTDAVRRTACDVADFLQGHRSTPPPSLSTLTGKRLSSAP